MGITKASKANALDASSAVDRVRWAYEQFGEGLVLSTSFGIQSAVMLHIVNTIIPNIPVIFLDTGYLFPETYQFAEKLKKRLNLNLKVYTPNNRRRTKKRYMVSYGKMT